MMTNKTSTPVEKIDDAELVARCLAGDRGAFEEIVGRYQSLVCSLAYSATGSLSASEDLAQETFLAAWSHLRELREPEKLRAWLCGIARHTINAALRRRGREPSHAAESLDALHDAAAVEVPPSAGAVSREEEALLWRALAQLPETYREPLVLFYREQESIARVAAALELSEEVVRQRLSRGRRLLQNEVVALVEGTLARTKPAAAFTARVLATVPVMVGGVTASGTKFAGGVAAAKTATGSAISAATLASLTGVLGGLFGWWVPAQIGIERARSPRERQFMKKVAWVGLAEALGFFGVLLLYIRLTDDWRQEHGQGYAFGLLGIIGVFAAVLLTLACRWIAPTQARIRKEENAPPSPAETALGKSWWFRRWNYRSKAKFLGLPLIVVCGNRREDEKFAPAVGWIAIGDVAVGGFFAAGGFAMAPISIGGLALGGLALGGAALGGWTIGGAAAGFVAIGGGALGWRAALGGLAVARDFAFGGGDGGFALHANDVAARAYFHVDALAAAAPYLRIAWIFLLVATVAGNAWLVFWLRRRSRTAASA